MLSGIFLILDTSTKIAVEYIVFLDFFLKINCADDSPTQIRIRYLVVAELLELNSSSSKLCSSIAAKTDPQTSEVAILCICKSG